MKQNRKGSRKGQDFTAQGIKNVANSFKDITTKKIPDAIGKMNEERGGSRKGRIINTTNFGSYDVSDIDEYVAQGNTVNPTQIMNYLVNEKGYTELKAWATLDVWEEDRFGPWDQRGGSRKGESVKSWFELDTDDPLSVNDTDNVLSYLKENTHDLQGAIDDLKSNGTSHSVLLNVIQTLGINPDTVRLGQRKGTGPLCDLGSVSGKGSRPENLGSIVSKIAIGRKRSINMDGEYIENN